MLYARLATLLVLAPIAGSVHTTLTEELSVQPHVAATSPNSDPLAAARAATAKRLAAKKAARKLMPGVAAAGVSQPELAVKPEGVRFMRMMARAEGDAVKDTFAPTTTTEAVEETKVDGTTTAETLERELEDLGIDISNYTANFTHTWGKQKNNVMGLPGWASVLVAGVAAALIMIIFSSVGSRLAHPLPFFASGEHIMKDRIECAREKVRALEAAVEAKKAQEKYEKEEEERKAREALEGPQPDGPSHDELVGEMLYRTQEVQRQAVGAVNDSIKQAAPLLARAAHVQAVFQKTVHEVQARGSDMALKEASNLYGKLKGAVGDDSEPSLAGMAIESSMAGDDLPAWLKFNGDDDESNADPPPFALLLSGMFAPAQLKLARNGCNSQILWNSMMLAVCTACLTIDERHGCPDKMVWAWIFGMLIANGLDVICCSFIASRCATAIGKLQDDEDANARIKKTGNIIWDSYIMLQANSGRFFKAYFEYQNVVDSYIYTLQKFLTLVSTIWGCFGLYVSIHDIIEDSLECDAKIVLWFMHCYSFFFLLFITWSIVGLLLWALKRLSSMQCVSVPILAAAKDSDDEVPFRMPVFQTLVRAFVLRDNNTMLLVKAGQLQEEVTNLEKEIAETQTKMGYRQAYLKELEHKQKQAASNEKILIDRYKEQVIARGGTLPDASISGSASSSGVGIPDTGALLANAQSQFADAAGSLADVDWQAQAQNAASSVADHDWQGTVAQSQAALGSGASSFMEQASQAASTAQAAAGQAAASDAASGVMQQAQAAAAQAQAQAQSAAARAADAAQVQAPTFTGASPDAGSSAGSSTAPP